MDAFIDPAFTKYYEEFPLVLVDIGASGGFKKNWGRANRHLDVIGFEPDDRSFVDLKKSREPAKIQYLNTALYKQKTSLDFYLTEKQQLSSILEPNRELLDRFPEAERFDVVETKTIKTDTLDSQLQKHKIDDVDFIKIDTQGSELFILQGATATLRKGVFGVEIEIEFVPIYRAQPLFSDVDNFLRSLGFQLFDLRPCYWKRTAAKSFTNTKGQVVFADAIYLRSIESMDILLSKGGDDKSKKSKLLKALTICMLYNHHDYALEIVEAQSSFFDDRERKLFIEKIGSHSSLASNLSARIPNFPGRGIISNMFYGLWKIMQPHYWKAIVYLKDGQRLEKY